MRARYVLPALIVAPLLMGGALFADVPAAAPLPAIPPVRVSEAWTRATFPGQTDDPVYMTVTAWKDDAIIGASSPQAVYVLMHRIDEHGSVMGRRPLAMMALPAAKPVLFRPGLREVTLSGLSKRLRRGDTVQVTLQFRVAPPLTLDVPVRKLGAMGYDDLQ